MTTPFRVFVGAATPDKIPIKIVQDAGYRRWVHTGHRWTQVHVQGNDRPYVADWFFRHRFCPKTEDHRVEDDMSWMETILTSMADGDLCNAVGDLGNAVGDLDNTNDIYVPDPSPSFRITPIQIDLDSPGQTSLLPMFPPPLPPTPKVCAKKTSATPSVEAKATVPSVETKATVPSVETKATRRGRKRKCSDTHGEQQPKKMHACAICARKGVEKVFKGASGLWYHMKHVHGAITKPRPRQKNQKTCRSREYKNLQ